MKTPKETAKSLVEKFEVYADGYDEQEDVDQISKHLQNAKLCAKMHIDMFIETLDLLDKPEYVTFLVKDPSDDWYNGYSLKDYYEAVKKEIDLLQN